MEEIDEGFILCTDEHGYLKIRTVNYDDGNK
jgi:hypothetical protein